MRRPQFAAVLSSTAWSVVRSAPLAPSCCSCYATMCVIGGSACWQTAVCSRQLARTCEPRLCWAHPIHCKALVALARREFAGCASQQSTLAAHRLLQDRIASVHAQHLLHCGTCVSRSSPCTAPHHVRCAAILCMIQPPIDVYPWRPVRCVSGGSMTPSSQRSVSLPSVEVQTRRESWTANERTSTANPVLWASHHGPE
jgi:hypothetical protein